jgi:hypothetical protein
MKKIITVILAILLCLSMLLSCTKDTVSNFTDGSAKQSENQTEKSESETLKESVKEEAPKDENPKDEEPKEETPKDEEPKDEEPKDEEPKDEDPKEEEPKDEDPKVEPTIVDPTVNINGVTSKWSLAEGICKTFNTGSSAANTIFEVNIPVTEAGSYTLNFNANLGLTRSFTSGSRTASLSLPKTVFKEGEPIPVLYSSSGLGASTTRPWIGITKNVGGLDKYISWEYVEANYTSILNAAAMTGQREDDSVASYVNLPAGEYKLHFITAGGMDTRKSSNWLIGEPINISIVGKNSIGTTVTRSGSTYGNASLTVKNNIFVQGESVLVDFIANGLKINYAEYSPWVGISKTFEVNNAFYDYYTHWYYTETTQSGTFAFRHDTGNYAQGSVPVNVEAYRTLPAGSYKIHYVNGPSFLNCSSYLEAIGINVAPLATLNASISGSSVLNTSDPYDIQSVSEAITVTDEDIAKGYVTLSFCFGALSSNTNYFLSVNDVSLIKQ